MRQDHAIGDPNHFAKIGSVLVAPAAPILTSDERAEPEGVVRSTMTHYRTRFKARTVLIAADCVATGTIAREVNCGIGIAAKWRVRYAKGPHTQIQSGWNSRKRRVKRPARERR
jgi:hypothetical protein